MKKCVLLLAVLLGCAAEDNGLDEPCDHPSRPIVLSEVLGNWYVMQMRFDANMTFTPYCHSVEFQADSSDPSAMLVTSRLQTLDDEVKADNLNATMTNRTGEYSASVSTMRFYYLSEDNQVLVNCLYMHMLGMKLMLVFSRSNHADDAAFQAAIDRLPSPGFSSPVRVVRTEEQCHERTGSK